MLHLFGKIGQRYRGSLMKSWMDSGWLNWNANMLGIFDGVANWFNNWFFGIFFAIDKLVMKLAQLMYDALGVFIGLNKVTYDGSTSKYLINVFFDLPSIRGVYRGMALIGIAMAFGFAIISVMRKIFDTSEKVKQSLGGIVGNLFKSILLILLMTFIVLAVLTSTNVLIQQITYVFDNAELLAENPTITFDSDEYAAMARVLDKIGNYSLNPSRDSRYNINSCYNDIRKDMLVLQKLGVFKYSYEDYTVSGNTVTYAETTKPTWQYVLAKIARAHDLNEEQPIDSYDENITASITEAMTVLETMNNFKPLSSYTKPTVKITSTTARIDNIIFLTATMDCARNSYYNKDASLYDALRAEYMNGSKSVYSWDSVKNDFDVYNFGTHLLIITIGLLLTYEFFLIAMNCASRIFNVILLYLAFPPFAATMSLDDGGKVRQWTIAFVVQSFNVFGTLIAVRLLMLFVPVIFNSNLVLFSDSFYNAIAKALFLVALSFTVEKAGGLITGILADQAGFQSVTAGNAGSAAASATLGVAGSVAGKAGSLGRAVVGKTVGRPIKNLLKNGWNTSGGILVDKFKRSSVGKSLSQFGNDFFGSGGQEYRDQQNAFGMRRDALKADLQSSDQAVQNAANDKLHHMTPETARNEYGMNQNDLTKLQGQFPARNVGGDAGPGADGVGEGGPGGVGQGGVGQVGGNHNNGNRVADQPPIRNYNNRN